MEKFIYINDEKTRYTVTSDGDVYSLNFNRSGKKIKLKPIKDKHNGYYYVNIYHNKKIHRMLVHRLVAIAFIPNPDNKPEVNHKNGHKKINKKSNLEWVTAKENTRHAIQNNLRSVHYGDKATDSKITQNTAIKICKLLEENQYGVREIADVLNVSHAIVSNIKHKKAWTHISSQYNIENHTIKSKPKTHKKKPSVKITEKDVKKICKMLQNTDLSVKEISKYLGIGKAKINAILYGNAWRRISDNYDFQKRRKR